MEYEFYLKIGYTRVNCKLNTHLAIESQIERKSGKSLYLLCYLKFNYSLFGLSNFVYTRNGWKA